MQVHEIIEDDLSIHYLIQMEPQDMAALKLAMKYAELVLNDATWDKFSSDTTVHNHAALIASVLAYYPILTYEEKMAARPLPKAD